mmetsp:Transcript_8766/g.14876  ORF Transcript_8766/g.14876 Transcript_8766/m.14876 type:complete len:86 (+) Transcript_8766:41-298(+)
MRFLQKRVASLACKRSSQVARYQPYLRECYSQNYLEEDEFKGDLETTFDSWGRYTEIESTDFRLTSSSEFYFGHFGSYYPTSGFI